MREKIALLPSVIAAGLLFAPGTASAQFNNPPKIWYGHVAGALVDVSGDAGQVLDDGWGLSAGATYRPDDWPIGVIFDLGYNQLEMTDRAIELLEASSGDGQIWSATAGALWSPHLRGAFGLAVHAGVGAYYVDVDPFYPGCGCKSASTRTRMSCARGWAAKSEITVPDSSVELGFSIGALVSFEVGSTSSIYLELRYHQVQSEVETAYMPLALGLRW